ncbi:recombinase family protein [Escherichia coli 2785200]|uniref:recombinase family protein n=1 Tax=Escherichia coli TaxID=562 RepID=UPI0002CBDD97|nr:recombinase family protein [Escherichia coli]EMW36325.1 recombinase family protein [Escherichia coli 2785200]
MRRAISYIRFSSERQLKGDSVRRQSKLVTDWLDKNPEVYLDSSLSFKDLGKSAFSGKHLKGGLGDFLTAIEKGLVKAGDTLLIESLDRLSRQDIDIASELLRRILRAGVDIVTLSDGEHYTRESLKDPLSLIKSILIMQRAHEESLRKSERVQAAWNRKKELISEGIKVSRRCPAWLRLNDDRRTFTIIPDKVEVVKRAFDLRLQGLSFWAITRTLNDEGHLSLNQYTPKQKGWSDTAVKKLLRNRAVIGCFTPAGREEVQGYYPAIISESLFYRVQQLNTGQYGRASVSSNPLSVNLFRGIIKCSECGATIVLGGYALKRFGMYRCPNRSANRCSAKAISRKQTDTTILYMLALCDRFETENTDTIDSLKLQREDLQRKISKMAELAIELDDMTIITEKLRDMKNALSKLNHDIEEETKRIKAITTGSLKDIDRTTKEGMIETQLLIKGVLKEIVIDAAKRRCKVTFHNGKVIDLPITENPSEDVTEAIQSLSEVTERGLIDVDVVAI